MTAPPVLENSEKDRTSSQVPFNGYLHGGRSSLLSTLVVFPVYKTVYRQQIHNTPIHEAVKQLYREGTVKLFRGVSPPLLRGVLNGTLLFGLQGTIYHQLSPSPLNVLPTYALSALAGCGAGVVEAVVFTPFERAQNVLQNGQNDRQVPTLQHVLLRLKEQRLALGYYRAFLPILARSVLGSSIYFGLKEPVRAAVATVGLGPMVSSFLSGTLVSMPVSLSLYPLSVLVANMQAQVGGSRIGLRESWRVLWESRDRSVRQLYRGGTLVILRSVITWGLTTAIYDCQERRSG